MVNAHESVGADEQEIRKLLASSPHYWKIADSVLTKLDRKTLADIIASYLYFKSRGRPNSEYAKFMLTRRLPEVMTLLSIIVPVTLPALIRDKEFRTLIMKSALR